MADSNRSFISIFTIFFISIKIDSPSLVMTICWQNLCNVNRDSEQKITRRFCYVYCCMTLLRHLCVKKWKNYFTKFIAKCGGGFAHMRQILFMDSKRRSDSLRFLAQKKNFMLCAVWCVYEAKWRELKFSTKKNCEQRIICFSMCSDIKWETRKMCERGSLTCSVCWPKIKPKIHQSMNDNSCFVTSITFFLKSHRARTAKSLCGRVYVFKLSFFWAVDANPNKCFALY